MQELKEAQDQLRCEIKRLNSVGVSIVGLQWVERKLERLEEKLLNLA